MGKLFIAGIVLFLIGNGSGNQDVLGIGAILLVIATAWFILKTFSGAGGSSGGSYGGTSYPYEFNGQRFQTEHDRDVYKDIYREAVRRNDPRF